MAVPGSSAGGGGVYVPTLDLSGNLAVRFSRNLKSYNVNKYVKLIPVQQDRGSYLYFNPGDQIRLNVNTTTPGKTGLKWASGTDRPRGNTNSIGFEEMRFFTQRFADSITLDRKTCDLANWDIQKFNTEALAQKMMTHRAWQVCTALFTSGNYPAGNYAATAGGVTDIGGSLYAGTTAAPYIKKAVDYAVQTILAATGGRITLGNISMLVNAKTAGKMSQSREIREYVMQQAGALDMVTGKGEGYDLSTYGLPKKLYGVTVLVEDLFFGSANKPGTAALVASEAATPIVPDNKLLFLVRTEDLTGTEGAGDYSTAAIFIYEDMTVEARSDDWNRFLDLSVVDDFDTQITAPVAALLIGDVSS